MSVTINFLGNSYVIPTEALAPTERRHDGKEVSVEFFTAKGRFTVATKDRLFRKVDEVYRAKKAWDTWTAMKPGLASAFLGKMVEDQVLRDQVGFLVDKGDIKVLKYQGGFYVWYSTECWAQNQALCKLVTSAFKDAVNGEEGWRLTSARYLGRTRMGCVKS